MPLPLPTPRKPYEPYLLKFYNCAHPVCTHQKPRQLYTNLHAPKNKAAVHGSAACMHARTGLQLLIAHAHTQNLKQLRTACAHTPKTKTAAHSLCARTNTLNKYPAPVHTRTSLLLLCHGAPPPKAGQHILSGLDACLAHAVGAHNMGRTRLWWLRRQRLQKQQQQYNISAAAPPRPSISSKSASSLSAMSLSASQLCHCQEAA